MSNLHLTRAIALTGASTLAERERHTLIVMANWACEACGLTWPGVPTLGKVVGCGTTSMRDTLRALADRGFLRVQGYAMGGGKCSTQYVVLPDQIALAAAPCPTCQANLAAGRKRGPRGNTQRRPVGIGAGEANGATLTSRAAKGHGDVEPNGARARTQRPKSTHPVRQMFASGTVASRAAQLSTFDDTSENLDTDTTARTHTRARQAERPLAASSGTPPSPPAAAMHPGTLEFLADMDRFSPKTAAALRAAAGLEANINGAHREPRNPQASAQPEVRR